MTYTNTQKDEMMNKVIDAAEELTGKRWRSSGAYATSDDDMMAINIHDYMDEFTQEVEDGTLTEYVKRLIDEQEAN